MSVGAGRGKEGVTAMGIVACQSGWRAGGPGSRQVALEQDFPWYTARDSSACPADVPGLCTRIHHNPSHPCAPRALLPPPCAGR